MTSFFACSASAGPGAVIFCAAVISMGCGDDPGPVDPPDPGPTATHLAFTVPPTDELVDTPFTPVVTVEVRDSAGARVPAAMHAVTLSIELNPGGAVLSGTTTVNAVDGLAAFPDITLDVAADGYALRATAAGLVPASSPIFRISAG